MWIKVRDGRLYNSTHFAFIEIREQKRSTRDGKAVTERTALREEEILPSRWHIVADRDITLASFDQQSQAQEWLNRFANQVDAFPPMVKVWEWD